MHGSYFNLGPGSRDFVNGLVSYYINTIQCEIFTHGMFLCLSIYTTGFLLAVVSHQKRIRIYTISYMYHL